MSSLSSTPFAFLRRWNLQKPVTRVCVNRRQDWFACATLDGHYALLETDDTGQEPRIVETEAREPLALERDADSHGFLAGSADGKVFLVEPSLNIPTPLREHEGAAISHVAATGEGLRAYGAGNNVFLISPEGTQLGSPLSLPEPLTTLTFGPKGLVLAIAHGTSLRIFDAYSLQKQTGAVQTEAPIRYLLWRSDRQKLYLLLTNGHIKEWSFDEEALCPRGPKLFTLEQDGPPPSFMYLSRDDHFLAAGGGTQTLCWDLHRAEAPGKKPIKLGDPASRLVTAIAPNPRDDLLAIGYNDGAVILAPLDGRKELVIFPPVPDANPEIIGLVWNADGDCLHAVLANGHIFLFTLKSVSRFVKGRRS